jgi:negative regulator of sigma E activity
MRPSAISRYGLPLLAVLVLTGALSLWFVRRTNIERRNVEQEQRVAALLRSTLQADNALTYSAISTVTARYGEHTMKARARLVRAPRKLSIVYLDGDRKGLHSGYNEKWFWRQDGSSPLEAYAAVEYRPDEMASRRFALMMKNYHGRLMGSDNVDGRRADMVELRPLRPVDGARGPRRRLWIDRDSGITLRSDTFNYQAQPVMTSVLSQVDLKPDTDNAFVPPKRMMSAAALKPWMAQEMGEQIQKVAQKTGIYPPQPDYRPPGFEFDSAGMHHCSDTGVPVVAALARYSDGINVLTIFAMKPDAKRPAEDKNSKTGWKRESCEFGPGTMAMRELPQGRLVAVSDLPQQTLNRVLDSTRIRMVTVGDKLQ